MEVWLGLERLVADVDRAIDADLRAEWAVPLGWFEVLRALRELGGRARPTEVATEMGLPPSSLSRRLDRLAEEGWVARHTDVDKTDARAVQVELTESGRKLWREMNITYRRSVQHHFASHLTDDQIEAFESMNRFPQAEANFG